MARHAKFRIAYPKLPLFSKRVAFPMAFYTYLNTKGYINISFDLKYLEFGAEYRRSARICQFFGGFEVSEIKTILQVLIPPH
jgi:hypothetical protein